MNFSAKNKMIKLLSLITVLILMTSLFAGCKKDDAATPPSTEGSLDLNLDLEEDTKPQESEAETEPQATETVPIINEKSATVTSQLNIRSAPSTSGSAVIGTLKAGDKVIVEERYEVTGIQWAYISSPQNGWICMDFVEMDIPDAPNNTTSTPAGSNPENQGNTGSENDAPQTTTSTKGVVTAELNIRKEPSTNSAVVGGYAKGDVVTILETKNGWGRTNKGWIKLEYVNTTGSTTNNGGNNNSGNNNSGVTGNGSTTVQFRGIVKVKELNIRDSASTSGNRLGSYYMGDRVEILEKSGSWGRTKKGWISLDYVYQDGTSGTHTATGTVSGSGLNIRSGPGTGYGSVGSLNKGDRVNILEQFTYDGTTWGCIKNGWISMDYVEVDGGSTNNNNNNNNNNSGSDDLNVQATITGSDVNIRSGPGTNYGVVGSLNKGERVTLITRQTVNGTIWGKIEQGWICMDYAQVN